jgi:hypothetical protein
MGNYVNYSKNYIDHNLNKFTSDVLNPKINKYDPLMQENLELMGKMNKNFEKFERFEKIYLSDKLQMPIKNYKDNNFNNLKEDFDLNYNKNHRNNRCFNGNDYEADYRNRIKSSNFHGNSRSKNNYEKQINNFIEFENKKFDPVFRDVNIRNFRTADCMSKNIKNIDLIEDYHENTNINFPRVYSFDENGKLVKNTSSFNGRF